MQHRGDSNNDFEKIINDINRFFEGFKKGGSNGGNGSTPTKNEHGFGGLLFIIAIIVVVLGGFNSFYTVQPEEEGVVTRFGRYVKTTQPGPHLKVPWVDEVFKIKSKRRQEQEFGYRENTASRLTRRGGRRVNLVEESLMLSGDLNLADVEWSVQYEISDPVKYQFKARNVVKNIRDVSMSVMRRVVGDRLVGKVLTTDRSEIAVEAKSLMQEILDQYDIGIRIITVVLQSVNPPESVKPAFNDVNAAKQEQEEAINRAEREYNKVIPEARGKAEQQIADAEAFAVDLVNRAKGDANHFDAILTEYRKAPGVTKRRIYLDVMEEIYSKVDKFTVVDSKVKGLLPVFGDLNKMQGSSVKK